MNLLNELAGFDLLRQPLWPALIAWAAGAALLAHERQSRGPIALVVLAALAAVVALSARPGAIAAPMVVALAVAALARDRNQSLHAECAIKLLWVMGVALALSFAGIALLTVATGTPVAMEQWAVLKLGLDPVFLWSTALPLSLLVGLVLLGVAPFHFWLADVFQGVRPWLAPLVVAALQLTGAAWLFARLDHIESFRPAAQLAGSLIGIAAVVAFAFAGATLLVQRRPERRIGTLASLNGALLLGALATGRPLAPEFMAAWAAHMVLALTGASTLSRFLPVPLKPSGAPLDLGAPLFRRHPAAGVAGLVGLFSLAGVPGTPGSLLWLEVARSLAATHRGTLLLVMMAAWLAALAVALRQMREAVGTPSPHLPVRAVPRGARLALWGSALGTVVLAVVAWTPR